MKKTVLGYRDRASELQGILVTDESAASRRPGVVLFPDARGIGTHAIARAEQLTALGFVVLVGDLYGGGRTAPDVPQAIELMNGLRADTARWRERAEAARLALAGHNTVDATRLAAIGYCFGGGTALELARTGADLAAVVSFHGGFPSERPEDAANIKARVLVCHGAADALVSLTQLANFAREMRTTNVDWQAHVYGGAAHGFTNPELIGESVPNHAYHADADRRSWAAMLDLFEDAFATAMR
ncbi:MULTISPECIES: dienelactone hydrolase family protein [unclassified Bradyrhizobium]|uniref:dienelactone hydrolase family protein n=1 Tax=unclassified Bradyrhizobium TaxID=2631580 RepID=UPI000416BDF1|nr:MULTISPECIES: dienelactone hydrolase family protein [unclassified Bradyrhizobium]MCP3464345.1 dienelactone hydrolase family protein [Bradyrhizobium sp. CCGUVB23]